jgi:hypothetical protein
MNDDPLALERRAAMATAAIALLLGLFAMNALPVGFFQDDGHYLILARALAHGDGYRYMNLPGAPAAAHFPPGYPLLLAPIWWMAPSFPANVVYFKLVNVVLLPVVALAIRALGRRSGGLGPIAASVVAIASVASVPVLFLNGLLFSETAFMAALFGLLPVVDRSLEANSRPSPRLLLSLGLATGALALLRTVGIALLPAALVMLGLRRRWRDAALLLAGALIVLVPWQLWASAHARAVPDAVAGAYGAYGPWLGDAWRTGGVAFVREVIAVNLRGLLIPLTLFGLSGSHWLVQATAIVVLVALAGVGARRLWPRASATLLLLIPYGALLLVWPFPPDRFLWPLWPIVLIAVAAGAGHVSSGDRSTSIRHIGRATTAALSLLFVVWHVRTWPTRMWESGEQANAHMGVSAAKVAAALPRDGLVASDQDAMVHLYAGRPAVPLLALTAVQHVRERTDAEVAAQMQSVLDAYHPRWVLVAERESLRAAHQLVQRGRLKLVAADTSGVIVYDVVR